MGFVFGLGYEAHAKERFSFAHPPIQCSDDWNNMLDGVWAEATRFADLVEQLPENRLWEIFVDEKYGHYYRNIQGITEHCHYHLGQIVLIKKMLRQTDHN